MCVDCGIMFKLRYRQANTILIKTIAFLCSMFYHWHIGIVRGRTVMCEVVLENAVRGAVTGEDILQIVSFVFVVQTWYVWCLIFKCILNEKPWYMDHDVHLATACFTVIFISWWFLERGVHYCSYCFTFDTICNLFLVFYAKLYVFNLLFLNFRDCICYVYISSILCVLLFS